MSHDMGLSGSPHVGETSGSSTYGISDKDVVLTGKPSIQEFGQWLQKPQELIYISS